MTDQYRRPSDLPLRIPLFPLRGAILLPRATLPLNVFELRYLEMVSDVMSGSRVIGIIQPKASDQIDEESPEGKSFDLQRIGCVGRVTGYQELEDSRIAITLTGVARFELLGESESDRSYRIVSVSYDKFASDFTEGHGEDDVDRARLLSVLKTYLEVHRLTADWEGIQRASGEQLINALSIMSPYGAEEKQALLEAPNLKTRADVLTALAEMEMASGVSGAGTLQ